MSWGISLFVIFELLLRLIMSSVLIFGTKKNTASTWSWLFVINLEPIIGTILYSFIGRGISKDKIFDLKMQRRIGLLSEVEDAQFAFKDGFFKAIG